MNESPWVLLDQAIHHLEKAAAGAPEIKRHAALLGRAYLLAGRTAEALPMLQSGYGEGDPPQSSLFLALAYMGLGNLEETERFATLSIEKNRFFARAFALRGECRLRRGNMAAALADLREACALHAPPDAYRLRLCSALTAAAFEIQGPKRKALLEESRDQLLASMPSEHVAAWRYLVGCVLLDLGDARRALPHLERTDFPDASEVSLRQGLCMLALGRFVEATEHLERVPASAGRAGVDAYLAAAQAQRSSGVEVLGTPTPRLASWPGLDTKLLLPGLNVPTADAPHAAAAEPSTAAARRVETGKHAVAEADA